MGDEFPLCSSIADPSERLKYIEYKRFLLDEYFQKTLALEKYSKQEMKRFSYNNPTAYFNRL